MDGEKLNKEGLKKVWLKIWSLIKLIVGDVDVEGKGDLQTQINNLIKKIPAAANNGKLTIQKNGTNVQSFTANQNGDATANIIVPNVTRSAAVTQEGQLALDAIEKNASIEGTLANELGKINSNLDSYIKFISGHTNVIIQAGYVHNINLYDYITPPSGYAPLCLSNVDIWGMINILWVPLMDANNPKLRLFNNGTTVYSDNVYFTVCFYKI